MFVLTESPTFEAEVRFEVQAERGGARELHAFTAVLARLDEDEAKQLAADIRTQDLDDRQVAARLLRGWGTDVCGGDGQPLPFNQLTLAQLLRRRGVARAVIETWHARQPKAVLGN